MNTKKLSIGLLTALCVALCALLAWFIIPQDVSAYADDETEDEIPVSLLVNGQIVTDVLSFTYGDSFVVEVSYNGNVYEPVLYLEESGAAFTQDHNELTVKQGSVLGETEIEVSRTFPDGREYVGILTIDIYTTVDLRNILVTDNERVMTVDLPDNVAYVDATVYMQDYVGSRSLRLYDGDVITEVLPESPHGICGLDIYITYVGMMAADYSGRSSVQSVDPDDLSSGKLIQTDRLSGSGTLSNPYLIGSQSDFIDIQDYNVTNTHFEQTQDITFYDSFSVYDFYGYYWGNNKKIIVSSISNQYSFLFKRVYGVVQYLTIKISGSTLFGSGYVGCVCRENQGLLNYINVWGQDYSNMATIVLWNSAIILNYNNNGYNDFTPHVTYPTGSYSGGIAGINKSYIQKSTCYLKVSGGLFWGGIACLNQSNANIVDCNALTFIKNVAPSDLTYIGGMVAFNSGKVTIELADQTDMVGIFVIFSNTTPSSSTSPVIGGLLGSNSYSNFANENAGISNGDIYFEYRAYYGGGNSLPTNVNTTHINLRIGD